MRPTLRWMVLLLGFAALVGCSDDDSSGNENNQNNNNGVAQCGNGVVEAGEQCDDGVGNSDLEPDACRSNCRDPWCGDGVLDTGEECDDEAMPADASCLDYPPYDAGELGCTATCEIDTSGCTECGDSVTEGDEVCDGTDLNQGTCNSVTGLQNGTLTCANDCTYDTSACWSCGNGNVEGPEDCDDGNTNADDGCSDTCQVEDFYHCEGEPSQCKCVVFVDGDPFIPASQRDGRTWATAFATVSEATDSAGVFSQNHGNVDCEVWVAARRYYIRQNDEFDYISLPSHVHLYGGFVGTETSRDQRDWVANTTTLDGRNQSGSMASHVFHVLVSLSAENASIDGFTIAHARAEGADSNGSGGGIYMYDSTDVTISNCVFHSHEAKLGGAMSVAIGTGVNVENCLFYDNDATLSAFGTYVNTGGVAITIDADITFTNCTFVNNIADQSAGGGGVLFSATMGSTEVAGPLFQNCILWNNTPDALATDNAPATVRYSDIQDSGYAGSDGNISTDPLFVSFTNFHLQASSPCIDVGDDAVAPATDAEDLSRVDVASVGTAGTTTDLGPYEYQP